MSRLGRRSVLVVTFASVVGLGGCTDVVMTNPLKSGSVQPNRALRRYVERERFRQMPTDSIADEARISVVDAQQICFDVTIRTLTDTDNLLDIRTGELQMSVDGKRWPTPAQLTANPPMARYVPGLVPHRQRVRDWECIRHSGRYCAEYGWRWHTRTTWHQGDVEVAESTGRACWGGSPITPATKKVGIKVTILRKPMAQQSLGDLMMGGDAVRPVWNWAFKDNAPTVVIHEQAPATATPTGPAEATDDPQSDPRAQRAPRNSEPPKPAMVQATPGDLLDVLTKDTRFTTFVRLLHQAGVAEKLIERTAQRTVLAPTDTAFAAFGNVRLKALTDDPSLLTTFISHHVLMSSWPVNQFTDIGKKNARPWQTVDDARINIWKQNGKLHIGEATTTETDVKATNGYIHVVDHVITD